MKHATVTRRQLRRRQHHQRRIALILLALLATPLTTAGAWAATTEPDGAAFDTTTAVTSSTLAGASRSATRTTTITGTGDWGGIETITGDTTRQAADNPTVAKLITSRDRDSIPTGFNPNHPTQDTGSTYSYSQCTWWAYTRRHQLNLPVGSHYGNGHQWADTARQLGYWVDNTPRIGDIMVFQRGQDGASPIYGHVAIVEQVNPDGSIDTSECGASRHGTPFTRHFDATNASQHQFIHY